MNEIPVILLAVASAWRIWSTVQDPKPWRVALSLAMVLVAVAAGMKANLAAIDSVAGPNAAQPAVHVFLAMAAGAVFVYVAFLRSERLPKRAVAAYSAATLGVTMALVATWSTVSLPDITVDDLNLWAYEPGLMAHQVCYCTWLMLCLTRTAVFCFRNLQGGETDVTRLLGLGFVGTALSVGALCFTEFAAAAIGQYATGDHLPQLSEPARTLLSLAMLLLVVGLLTLLAAPVAEQSMRALRNLRNLRHLHLHLTAQRPNVRLKAWGLFMREQRAFTEIRDALNDVKIDPHTPSTVKDVAAAVLTPVSDGVRAATKLPPPGSEHEADRKALLDLARAFTEAAKSKGNAHAPQPTPKRG